jgi:hypothetical protein
MAVYLQVSAVCDKFGFVFVVMIAGVIPLAHFIDHLFNSEKYSLSSLEANLDFVITYNKRSLRIGRQYTSGRENLNS